MPRPHAPEFGDAAPAHRAPTYTYAATLTDGQWRGEASDADGDLVALTSARFDSPQDAVTAVERQHKALMDFVREEAACAN